MSLRSFVKCGWKRHVLAGIVSILLLPVISQAQAAKAILIPPESSRFQFEGQSEIAEYKGRRAIYLNGGVATIKDLEIQDGIIDVDIATPAERGFFGVQFRISGDDMNGEWVYLRQHKSGLPDAIQYTPILNTGLNWQLYNGTGFTGAIGIPKDEWFHLRLIVTGAQATLFVKDMEKPALLINDLKRGVRKGSVALAVLTGATYFSNFEVRETSQVRWERRPPPMPEGTLTRWSLSPSYDALSRKLEQPFSAAEAESIQWQDGRGGIPGLCSH